MLEGNILREYEQMISYKPEMLVEGEWSSNSLRFATEGEADRWGADLMMRWFVPTDHRVIVSADPVNYKRLEDGTIQEVKLEP